MTVPTPHRADRFLVVGTNHQSSSLALRDRLFIEDAEIPGFLTALAEGGIGRAVAVSTCDRVDIVTVHQDPPEAAQRIIAVLARRAGLDAQELATQLYVLNDEAAVRHVFATASSLDSQVIGEPQVLGQLKACHRLARDAGMSGGDLEAVLQAAYGAAKRVRSETAIGQRPVSMAAAAVQVARDLHGDPAGVTALLIGAADMGVTIAEQLLAAGLGDLTVMHPRESRGEAVALRLGCHTAPYDRMADAIAESEIVICAVGTRRRILESDMVLAALRRRRRRPILIVDTGIPGDVDPAVNRLEEAFLYDMDDLERVALEGLASRDAEAAVAWRIVEEDVAAFRRDRAHRAAGPALTQLREHFEETRRQVLEVAGDDSARATQLLINRLLHRPSEALRDMAAGANLPSTAEGTDLAWAQAERLLRRLFRLDSGESEMEAAARKRRKET